MREEEIKKILIIRLSALGDTIHTLPSVYALRKKFPNAQIDWIVEDKASKIVLNNPLVDNVFVVNKKNLNFKTFFDIISKLRKQKYDIALDFQQLLKSGIILGLSGAKRRITLNMGREFSFIFANEIVKTDKKLFDINYHVVKRNLDLTHALNCDKEEIKFVLPDFTNEYSQKIKDVMNNLDKSRKTVVLAPATTWINKHWTVEGWRNLIEEFKDSCNIIISATKNDKILTEKILQGFNSPYITDLTGKTNISDLFYIFKNCDLVVSPDSGSAHIAWAAGAKSIITLFFATSSNRTAPFGKNYFSISANTKCSPCMKKNCRLKQNKNLCVNSINYKDIINLFKTKIQF